MRNPTTLEALFPDIRARVLAATFRRPEKWWYLSELADELGTGPSSLQRELRSLVAGGVLRRRQDGRRTYFSAETQSPVFADIRNLFEKTAGLIPTLQGALEPLQGRVACAFVYGSVAQDRETAASDVDLLVVGETGLAELSPVLRRAEQRLGREVNVIHFSAEELRRKAAAGEHFVAGVLRGPKRFVKGTQRDLDSIIG